MSRRDVEPSINPPRKEPLRVGFVTPPLRRGGAERWILSLARCFPSDRVQAVGILRTGEGPLDADAARLCRLYGPENAGEFLDAVDVVLAWGVNDLTAIIPRTWPKPVVAVAHGTPELEWARTNCAAMLDRATHLAAVSEDAARSFPTNRRIEVLYNGAEVDRVVPTAPREVLRAAMGLTDEDQVLLFAGRVSPEKRPWIVADMLHLLPPEWRGIIAGPNYLGIEIPQHPRLEYVGEFDRPGDLLAIADVFLLPSTHEAHAIALNEAWLAGVPTVCGDWPCLEETVRAHEVYPHTVDVDANPDEWAAAIEDAAEDWDTAEDLRALAWSHYTAAAMAERWTGYLERITANRGMVAFSG